MRIHSGPCSENRRSCLLTTVGVAVLVFCSATAAADHLECFQCEPAGESFLVERTENTTSCVTCDSAEAQQLELHQIDRDLRENSCATTSCRRGGRALVVPVPPTTTTTSVAPTSLPQASFWEDVLATGQYDFEPALLAMRQSKSDFVQTLFRALPVSATSYALPTRDYDHIGGCCRGTDQKKDFGSFDEFSTLVEDPHACSIQCDQTENCTGYEVEPVRWSQMIVFYRCEVHTAVIVQANSGFHCGNGKKSCYRAACGTTSTASCDSPSRALEIDFTVEVESCSNLPVLEPSFDLILREGLDLNTPLYGGLPIFDEFEIREDTPNTNSTRAIILLNPAIPNIAYEALTAVLFSSVVTAHTFDGTQSCGIIITAAGPTVSIPDSVVVGGEVQGTRVSISCVAVSCENVLLEETCAGIAVGITNSACSATCEDTTCGAALERSRRQSDPDQVDNALAVGTGASIELILLQAPNTTVAGIPVSGDDVTIATTGGTQLIAAVTETFTKNVIVPDSGEIDSETLSEALTTPTSVLARPFFTGDAQDMINSFDKWESYPPCSLDSNGIPTAAGLPLKLALYYSGDSEDSDIRALFDPFLVDDGAEWRKCFSSITLSGANLTEAQDQYHSRQNEPTWNLGPNMQFYRLLKSLDQNPSFLADDFMYYMEADNQPVVANWLDLLVEQVEENIPFSVLGGLYSGHNWDNYDGDEIIKPALRNHLNGNAVYTVNHPVIQHMLSTFTDDNEWYTTPHSSFDVAITEYLLEVQNVAVADLASSSVSEYKATNMFSNFATTLVLPEQIPTGTDVIHGGVFVQNWPTPECPRSASPAWYPAKPIVGTVDTSITLVVSDFGDGAIAAFMTSLQAAREGIDSTCVGETLPFTDITVIAEAKDVAAYQTAYPDVTFTARSIGDASDNYAGGNAWWDMCNANVQSKWFMLATSNFSLGTDFKLAVEVDESAGAYLPLAPYVLHDSAFCNRDCRLQIEEERRIYEGFNSHFSQEFAVINTVVRDGYCALLLDGTVGGDPSINGYFAYIERQDAIAAATPVAACEGVADDLICGEPGMLHACNRDDAVGEYVRDKCKVTCGTCSITDSNSVEIEAVHEMKPTYEWWERKFVGTESNASMYRIYNREKLFTIGGFDGPPAQAAINRGERCNGGPCDCIFPFFFDNQEYTDCVVPLDGNTAPWCPTSLTNTREYLPSSDDYAECTVTRHVREVNYFGRVQRGATNCSAGQYVESGTCATCPSGHYQTLNEFTGTACSQYAACPVGEQLVSPDADAAVEVVCTPCGNGFFKTTTGNYDTTCNEYTSCPVGEQLVSPDADAAVEVTCTPCGNGFFKTTTGNYDTTCIVYTACPQGEERMFAEPEDPAVFVACSDCVSGYFKSGVGNYNTRCAAYTDCFGGGFYYKGEDGIVDETGTQYPSNYYNADIPDSTTTDRICIPVTECASGKYRVTPASTTANTACLDLAPACDTTLATNYEQIAATTTSDRVCQAYTVDCILYQSFESTPRTLTSDRICTSVSKCTTGNQWIVTLPTVTANTVCAALTTCVFDTHVVVNPTIFTAVLGISKPTEDASCTLRATCPAPFEYQSSASTSTTTVCSEFNRKNKVVEYPYTAELRQVYNDALSGVPDSDSYSVGYPFDPCTAIVSADASNCAAFEASSHADAAAGESACEAITKTGSADLACTYTNPIGGYAQLLTDVESWTDYLIDVGPKSHCTETAAASVPADAAACAAFQIGQISESNDQQRCQAIQTAGTCTYNTAGQYGFNAAMGLDANQGAQFAADPIFISATTGNGKWHLHSTVLSETHTRTCIETASSSQSADAAACAAFQHSLDVANDQVSCALIKTAADPSVSACTYNDPNGAGTFAVTFDVLFIDKDGNTIE